tara:strand:+ start:3076 stop:4623 length:1548 start_codon:yes stop_codon:yes gene_type:complete
MDKYLKIQSQQSLFSNTANLVDFTIPQADVYDLSDSWINMNWVTSVVEVATAGTGTGTDAGTAGVGIYNSELEWTPNAQANKHAKFFNSSLIRDATFESSRQGILESLQRIDILSQVKQTYDKSFGEAMSESYKNAAQMIQPINHQNYGIETQFNKEGSNKSVSNLNNQVMIRLGDVMDICNATEYDTMKSGQTRVHFRLNMDKVAAVVRPTAGTSIAEVKAFRDLRVSGARANTITLGSAGAAGVDQKPLHLFDMPYYVGEKVAIAFNFGADGAGTAGTAYGVISSIVWDKEAGGTYSLSFEQDWATGAVTATDFYQDIILSPVSPDSSTATLAMIQLVLKRVANPVGADRLDYTTYSTEQGNGNSQKTFNQVFPTEAEATNVLMTFQDGGTDLISRNSNIVSSQVSVNNMPLTDRLVHAGSPLDYDRKVSTFRRLGSNLSNLVENAGEGNATSFGASYTVSDFKTTIIASPLPVTPRQKQLSVHIVCGNGAVDGYSGVGAYALFKSLPRSLVY